MRTFEDICNDYAFQFHEISTLHKINKGDWTDEFQMKMRNLDPKPKPTEIITILGTTISLEMDEEDGLMKILVIPKNHEAI